jgi:hypothetical protein
MDLLYEKLVCEVTIGFRDTSIHDENIAGTLLRIKI